MAKLVAFFVTLLSIYVNGAAVTPVTEAQENTTTTTITTQQQINELLLQMQALVKNVTTSIQNALPDNKEITDSVISQTQQLSQTIQAVIGRIQSEINNNRGNLDNLLKATTATLGGVLSSVQGLIGAENRIRVSEIRNQLVSSLNSATTEVQKLTKAIPPEFQRTGETLQKFATGIVNDVVKTVDNVRIQVNALPLIGRK